MPFFFEIGVRDKSDDTQKDKLSMSIFGVEVEHFDKFGHSASSCPRLDLNNQFHAFAGIMR